MLAALTSFVKRCCGGSAYAATEEDSPPPNGESDRPFVSAHWLWQNRTSVKIVDGRHLQSNNLTAAGAYVQGHIPSAIFFDIARFTYPYNDYFFDQQMFNTEISKLGIGDHDTIIVYDDKGCISSPRVWFTLKHFGAKEVFILNGGFCAWENAGYPVEAGNGDVQRHRLFDIRRPNEKYRIQSIEGVREIVEGKVVHAQLVDCRSSGHYTGRTADFAIENEFREYKKYPLPSIGSPLSTAHGHIPGSLNLPWQSVLTTMPCEKGQTAPCTLKSNEELLSVFAQAGIHINPRNGNGGNETSLTLLCGSGITSCTVVLALYVLGYKNMSLFDGSFLQWVSEGGAIERGNPSNDDDLHSSDDSSDGDV